MAKKLNEAEITQAEAVADVTRTLTMLDDRESIIRVVQAVAILFGTFYVEETC
jgi:hypothetical protein